MSTAFNNQYEARLCLSSQLARMARPAPRWLFGDCLADRFTVHILLRASCVRSVPEWIVFNGLGLALSEKQSPRFVVNVSS